MFFVHAGISLYSELRAARALFDLSKLAPKLLVHQPPTLSTT